MSTISNHSNHHWLAIIFFNLGISFKKTTGLPKRRFPNPDHPIYTQYTCVPQRFHRSLVCSCRFLCSKFNMAKSKLFAGPAEVGVWHVPLSFRHVTSRWVSSTTVGVLALQNKHGVAKTSTIWIATSHNKKHKTVRWSVNMSDPEVV